jgi:GPH family glycoside/pentoside/hexuronide:cation symporter
METTTVSTQPQAISEPSTGVSSREKLGMGFWAFTIDLRSHFSGTYRQYFLTNIFHLAPALAGILGMIGSLWNGLNDPFIGYIVHKRHFRSGERIRPYAKLLALPVALLLPLYFLNFHAPVSIKVLFVLALIFFGDIISTFYDIAYTGLPLVMTDKQPERVAINTHISAGAAIGVVLGTLIFWPLLQFFGGVNADGTIIRLLCQYRTRQSCAFVV